MFDASNFSADMLSNPTKLSKAVIDGMQSTDTINPVVIGDPNNGFVMQLFANACLFSKFAEKLDYLSFFSYPQRARNAQQLFPHLSQFDYVKLMASPATLPFIFAMSKSWVINNSVYYDTNYNKLEIPATSYFTLGGVTYSGYYPIDILVNRNTGTVTAQYNTDSVNGLYTLPSNMLLQVQEYTQNGITYFQIEFNMFQYTRKDYPFTAGAEAGFIKKLSYDDQFYAVKVFTQSKTGIWSELDYSLSDRYYDYQTPTAVLSLMPDTSQIQIEIPQIYFDNGQVSQTVKVELYSTKGSLNYAISSADIAGVKAYFDPTSSVYSAPMAQMPSWTILPSVLQVEGGSDTKTYDEIRTAIVKDQLHDRVAVTALEIAEAGRKAGFNLTRVIDDLTERMYYASNILTDSQDMVVPTFVGSIKIADDALTGNPSTIVRYPDGYYTMLPTTVFTVGSNGQTCTPMSNGQVATLAAMTQEQLTAELNKGVYVRQPFHLTLQTAAKSPQALTYNLMSPSMTSLIFEAEHTHSAPQMSVTACALYHLTNGTGGYQIILGVTRSSNIALADIGQLKLWLTTTSKNGNFVYLPASYLSTDENGVDHWKVQIATNYHLTSEDYLTISMYNSLDTLSAVEIPLNPTFTVLTSFNNNYDTNVPVDASLNALLPPSVQNSQIVMAKQTMIVSLGTNLSSLIYSGVNTSWGNDVYQTADQTLYHQTDRAIFQETPDGRLHTRINPTTHTVEVVELYARGDVPVQIGDLKVSVVGNGTTGSRILTVNDATAILPSMAIRGLHIPVSTTVQSVTGNQITLSKSLDGNIEEGEEATITCYHGIIQTAQSQSAPGKQLSVLSTTDMVAGLSVTGFGIPKGTLIQSVDSPTQITLDHSTTEPLTIGWLLTILNKSAPGVVRVKKGDVVLDPTGKPIVVKDAQNQYLIPAILFDGRLFGSNGATDQSTISTIAQKLQNYANQISTIDPGLVEDSRVYYKPSRTMGPATFGVGGGKTITLPLELSFTVFIYVDPSVYNSQTLLSSMSETVVSVINTYIQQSIISVSEITAAIASSLGSNVSAVEMGDISDREGLRLIALEQTGCSPSLENILVTQSDGTVIRKPNVTITYLPKPDTSNTATTV